jgi:hypothetical protein
VRIVNKRRLKERDDENGIVTEDSDHRGECACGVVAVRMQPTGGNNQRATGNPGASCPFNATDGGTDSYQQSAGPHVAFVTAA